MLKKCWYFVFIEHFCLIQTISVFDKYCFYLMNNNNNDEKKGAVTDGDSGLLSLRRDEMGA